MAFRPHEYPYCCWRLQATLTGPAVYELHGVDTIPAVPGDQVLTFWRNSCLNPLGCYPAPPRALCSEHLTVKPGESIVVRVDLRAKRCVREVRPRPRREADPRALGGRLMFANGGCPYLLDRDAYFWSLRLPASWSIDRGYSRVVTANGEFVGHRRDRVRVRGTRSGAYSTDCAAHILGKHAADYRITDMRIVRRAEHSGRP